MEAATKSAIWEVELQLEAEIDVFRSEILRWMVGAIGLQTIVILEGLFGIFHFFFH